MVFMGIDPGKLPEFKNDQEIYKYLLEETARMDCPECGELCCIEDLLEI